MFFARIARREKNFFRVRNSVQLVFKTVQPG